MAPGDDSPPPPHTPVHNLPALAPSIHHPANNGLPDTGQSLCGSCKLAARVSIGEGGFVSLPPSVRGLIREGRLQPSPQVHPVIITRIRSAGSPPCRPWPPARTHSPRSRPLIASNETTPRTVQQNWRLMQPQMRYTPPLTPLCQPLSQLFWQQEHRGFL